MSKKNYILIEATPHYIENQSSAEEHRFVFAYTISISNAGSNAAKLLSRHWLITDANGKIQEVKGEGVVGEQPYLRPGDVFRYTSGAIIETQVGVMQGKYLMISDEGEHFNAIIPKFTLSVPRVLH
ncbi:MAG: Co2+/Mg2+ efflux protein ApaG [Gammaproteobacteria bacterium]